MRVILDTNILISAFFYLGIPAKIIEKCTKSNVQIFHSQHIHKEFFRIINKPPFKLQVRASKTLVADINQYFKQVSIQKYIHIDKQYTVRDKNDAHILSLAEQIQADYIITGDNDLLVLKKFKSTQIITAKKFLKLFN